MLAKYEALSNDYQNSTKMYPGVDESAQSLSKLKKEQTTPVKCIVYISIEWHLLVFLKFQ